MSTLVEIFQNRIKENKNKPSQVLSIEEITTKTYAFLKQIETSLLTDSRWESVINNIIEKIKTQPTDINYVKQVGCYYTNDYYTILEYTKEDHMSNDKIVPFNLGISYDEYVAFIKQITIERLEYDRIENIILKINAPGHILNGCRISLYLGNIAEVRLFYSPEISFCTLI